ncbi:MAG TPA: DUF6448 family protein [Gemmatimonadales bacterium]|nr:DUF6448 family protein [Gemmatimonadales bacterium]
MTRRTLRNYLTAAAMVAVAGLALPASAAAHCDSMDGPVVKAAQQAVATRNVSLTLAWVRPQDEPAIREAFARTLRVRAAGGDAAELADLWFFETLVRIHRQGEGEPYTGLQPAGTTAEGIAAADRALAQGSADALAKGVAAHAAEALQAKFARVQELRSYDPADAAAGRAYVAAYVEYIHFVETLHRTIHGGAPKDH